MKSRKIASILNFRLLTALLVSAYAGCLTADETSDCCDFETSECCYDQENPCVDTFLRKANILYLAPEFSFLDRKREGGTKQSGTLYGIRASYDHIKRYKLYWGIQGYYAQGTVKGHTGADSKIKSKWTDELIEGNIGYTFRYKYSPYFSFTPFVGAGYFRETNKFGSPSPIHLKFITQFPYISYGFLSSITFSNCLNLGLNVRLKSPWDIRCHVKDDPDFDDLKLLVGEKLQYRIELPIIYCKPFVCGLIELGVTPFYESRAYGGKENFPFDYFETQVRVLGFNIQFIYRF